MALFLRPQRVDLKRQATATGGLSTASTAGQAPSGALKQRAVNTTGVSTARAGQALEPDFTPSTQQGRRFVNLGEWMGLNREQGQAAAQRVGDRLEGQAKGADAAQQASRDEFTGGVKTGTFDPNMRNPAAAKAAGATAYSGPTQLNQTQSFADATKKTDEAARDLQLSNRELARREFGGGQYGAGEQSLDALLLGQGNSRLQELRDRYSGLSSQWTRSQQDAGNIAQGAQAESAANVERAQQAATQRENAAIEEERKASAAAGDQWMRDNGVSAMVQRAWIEAGRPALGPWLQQTSPELYKKYSGGTGKTSSSQGLKATPNRPQSSGAVEMS